MQDFHDFVGRLLFRSGVEAAIQRSGEWVHDNTVEDILAAEGVREIKGPDGAPFLSGGQHNELRLLWCLSVDFFNPYHNKIAGKVASVNLLDLLPPPSPLEFGCGPSFSLSLLEITTGIPLDLLNPLSLELYGAKQSKSTLNAIGAAPSINDGIEVFDAIQSTPTIWDPTPPVSSGQMELQGTPTGLDPILEDSINQQGVIADGEDSRMASPIQYNNNDSRRDSSEPVCLGIKLGPSSQLSLRAAIEATLPEEPETIKVRSSSTPHASRARSKGRDHSRSSAWTHLTYESGCSEELAYFREAVPVPTNIAEFFGDIEKAIKCPMLAPPIDLSDMEVEGEKGDDVYGVGYSAGQREDLEAMIHDLREEIGRDVSEGASGWSEFYL
ncbi:hypothetical protein BJY52DRAFT_1183238 [Lactarius psammicola]|nr:hypothetical protein BJY52DRAFT_1183238 [Lactarius psammicola]